MARVLTLIIVLATSFYGRATDFLNATNAPFGDPPLLTTPEFAYYSIWIGNVCAFFDIIGWSADWIANAWIYKKSDTPEVLGLKKQLRTLHAGHQQSHQMRIEKAVGLCATIRRRFTHGKAHTLSEKTKILSTIDKIQKAIDDEFREELAFDTTSSESESDHPPAGPAPDANEDDDGAGAAPPPEPSAV